MTDVGSGVVAAFGYADTQAKVCGYRINLHDEWLPKFHAI
jgi:hypothetical protein